MANTEDLNPKADNSHSPLVSFLKSVKIDKLKNFTKDRSDWEIVSSFEIVSPDFVGSGESKLLNLSINESMFSPFISGHIDVIDKLDWIGQLNISGNELLTVEFGFIDSQETVTFEFFVCNMKIINNFTNVNTPKLNTTEKVIVYRLEFISDEIFNTQYNKSLLEFDKDFIGLIAANGEGTQGLPGLVNYIATKLDLTFLPGEIEETKNGIWLKSGEISLPNGIPQGQINLATLMSYITNYAVPKDNIEAPNYFFWKDRDGWHFKSIEKILRDQEGKEPTIEFDLNSEDYADFNRVMHVEVNNQKDTLDLFQSHAFMSHYVKTDPDYKNLYSDFLSSKKGFTYSIVDYDYHRDFEKVRHIEEYKLIPEHVETSPVKIQRTNSDNSIKSFPIPNTLIRDNIFSFYTTKIYNTPFEYNIHHSTDHGFGKRPDEQAIIWWDYLDREKDSRWSNVAWQPQFDITELEIKKLHTIYTKIREPLKEKRKEFVRLKNLKRQWEVYRCVVCCATNPVGSTADNEVFRNPLGITNPDEFNALFGKDGIFGGEQEYKIVAAGSFTDTINYESKNYEIQHGLTLAINLDNPGFTLPQGVNLADYNPNVWYKESIGQFFNLKNNINLYLNNVIQRGVRQYDKEIANLREKVVLAETFLENVETYITEANSWIESRLLPCCSSNQSNSDTSPLLFVGEDDQDYSQLCNYNFLPDVYLSEIFMYGYRFNILKAPDENGNATGETLTDGKLPATGFASVDNFGWAAAWGGVYEYFPPEYFSGYNDYTPVDDAHLAEMQKWNCHNLFWNAEVQGSGGDHCDALALWNQICPQQTFQWDGEPFKCATITGDPWTKCTSRPISRWQFNENSSPWTNSIYGGPVGNQLKRCSGGAVACGISERNGTRYGHLKPLDSNYENYTMYAGLGTEDTDAAMGTLSQTINDFTGSDSTIVTYDNLKCGGFYCYGKPGSAGKWISCDKNAGKKCPWQSIKQNVINGEMTQCESFTFDFFEGTGQIFYTDYGLIGPWEEVRKEIEQQINNDTASSCGKTYKVAWNGLGYCVSYNTRDLNFENLTSDTEKNIDSPGPAKINSDCPSKITLDQYASGKPCDTKATPTTWETVFQEYSEEECSRCSERRGLYIPRFTIFAVGDGSGNNGPGDVCQEGGPACLKQGCTDPLTGSVFSREPSACVGFNYVDGLGEVPLIVLPRGQCIKCNNFLEGVSDASGPNDDVEFDNFNCCNCTNEQKKTYSPLPEWAKECSKEKFMKAIAQFIGTEGNWYYNYGYIPGGGAAFADLDDYIGPNGDVAVTRRCLDSGDCYNKLCFNPLYLEVEGRRAKQEIKLLNAQIKLLEYTKSIVQQGIVTKFTQLYEEWWNRKAFFYSKMPGKNVFTDVSTGLAGSIQGGRTGPIRSDLSLFNIKSIKKRSIRGSRYELLARAKGITGATLGEWLYNFAWNQPAQNTTATLSGNNHPYYSQKYQSPFITQRQLYKNYTYLDSNPLNNFPFDNFGEQPYSPDYLKCGNNVLLTENAIVSLPASQVSSNFGFETNLDFGNSTQSDLVNSITPSQYSNTFNLYNIQSQTVPANLKREQLTSYIRIEFEDPIGLDRIIDFPNGFVRDAGTEYFLPYLVSLTAGPTGRQTVRNNVVVIGMDPYGFDVAVKKSKVSDEETDKQYHWWEEYRNLNDTSLTNNGMDLWPEVGFETSYPYYTADPKGWWWKSEWYHGGAKPDVSSNQLETYDWFQRSADVDPEYKESAHGSGYLQYSYRRIKPHRSWWSFHVPKNIFIPQKLFAVLSKKFGANAGDSTGYIGNLFAYKYQDYYWWYGDELDRWLRLTKEGVDALGDLKILAVQSADFGTDTTQGEALANHAFVHSEISLEQTGHGAVEKYFHQTTLHWLFGDFILYKPGLVTTDVWKYDLTGESDYGMVSPKTMAPNYDLFDDNFSAQFIVFSRNTKDLCSKFTCANPLGPVSNALCPPNDPYCLCPAKEHIPKEKEPSYLELYRKYKEIKECTLILENLGPDYLGCVWSDPANPCSCNCPEVGKKFVDYLEYTRTYATFWDTPRKTPLNRKALMSQFGAQTIVIQVPPTSKVKIGDIVKIKQDITVAGVPIQEKNLHGRWLVTEIVNGFYKDSNQKMKITLVRDTMSRNQDSTVPDLLTLLDSLF
jgi:hypothetical protein